MQKPKIGANEQASLNRPAWTQYDLFAFKHLHIVDRTSGQKRIAENYFIKTKGELK